MLKYLLILSLVIGIVSCKNEDVIAELGKKAPDYTFTNILNSTESEIAIHDLKGKVVVLEFWATWCSPCIPAMKKLDSLQKEFKDELEVIAISFEKRERLEKFIKSSGSSLKIASDTAHADNFKYRVIPHSIIIDKNGIVRAISNPKNINAQVIRNLISGNKIDLELKDDFYVDPNLEVKTIKSVVNSNYRIELKSYDQEYGGGSKLLRDTEGNINGIEMWNSTIPRLYQTLLNVASPSRMIYKDSLSKADFPYKKEFQYNLTIEASDKYQDKWKQIGIEFLNDHFDVNARMGMDTLACYVLRNVDNTIEESKHTSSEYMFRGTTLKAKKIEMSRLAGYLENFTPIPVLDRTNLSGEYDVELEWQAEDPKTLHTELKKYGLKLEKSNEKLPVEVMEIYRKSE